MTKVTLKLRRTALDLVKSHTVKQFAGTNTSFQGLSMQRNGQLTHGLSKEEQAQMEQHFGYEKGYLNPIQAQSGDQPKFWDLYKIVLPTNGLLILETDNPVDFMKYKYLLSKGKKVAASLEELELKPDAEFVLVEEGSEAKTAVKLNQTRKKARKLTDEYSSEERQTLIMVYGENTGQRLDPRSMGTDALEAKVDELVEANPERVISIIEHPEYKTHGKIVELYSAGIIEKRNDAYFSTEGALLGTDLDEMVVFLKDKTRSVEVANLYKKLKK